MKSYDVQKLYLPAQKPGGVQYDTWSHFRTAWKWVWESTSPYRMYPGELQVFCACETPLVITTPQSVCSVLLFYTVPLMKNLDSSWRKYLTQWKT